MYEASNHGDALLRALKTFRDRNDYSDVTVLTKSGEIRAHRIVLAATSARMHSIMQNGATTIDLRQFDAHAIRLLVDYAYTGRIECDATDLATIARAAHFLNANDVVEACVSRIGDELRRGGSIPCLVARRLGIDLGVWGLVERVDRFIVDATDEERDEIMCCGEFLSLPRVRVDVTNASSATTPTHPKLFQRVVERMESAYAGKILLLQETGCHFHFDDDDFYDDDDVREPTLFDTPDRHATTTTTRSQMHSDKTPARRLRLSSLSSSRSSVQNDEGIDWKVLTVLSTTEHGLSTGLVILDGQLVVLMISSPRFLSRSSSSSLSSPRTPVKRSDSCCQELIGSLKSARCSMGACVSNGKIYAVGGYNRLECLDSMESYSVNVNEWSSEVSMSTKRARFALASIDNDVYACGGSDGRRILQSAEKYDTVARQWVPIAPLKKGRSRLAGVALGSCVYVIGGLNEKSRSALNVVEKYDVRQDVWVGVSSLRSGRIEASVASLDGRIYVVGGSGNGWSCLASVESYDPRVGLWENAASLQIGRRGGGVAALNGKLYVVGGHDSVSSLSSVEVFDLVANQWAFGSSMNCPRCSGSLVELDDVLYAVGGFNGSTFLSTVEYNSCSSEDDEWHQLVPYAN